MQLSNILILAATVAVILFMPATADAQGSIFGSVQNSDFSTPPDGALSFFGFLDGTDEEIRIESSTGAGYDAGNWFDDFQNYLTEAAGNPYDYYFYNASQTEGFHLAGTIPNNSFQQEDVTLQAVAWPIQPGGLSGRATTDTSVIISWQYTPDLAMHIYRRPATSEGSFFRIDNPDGDLSDPGVADSQYVDTAVDGTSLYDYVLIAEDASGNYSPRSSVVTVNSGFVSCCVGMTGDINGDGVDGSPLDLTHLVDFMFFGGQPPTCEGEADLNGDGIAPTPLDLTYLVDNLFNGGQAPLPCQ